ncbi:MAG: CPBP family intramembrane metalloprotease [Planctomycetaceae bacterium]|nr:CPBP family intramembrane metalloprotease [Planctomycetaceae bacterium]
MTQFALGIAGLLVMLILGAGAACWTIALLKWAATSRFVPEPAAGLAAQILIALGYKPAEPLIPWSPRRPVPWALVDLLGILGLYVLAFLLLRLVLGQLGWLPAPDAATDEFKLTLDDKQILVWANIVASLGLITVAGPLIALRTGATWRDFGFSARDLWKDFKLGLIGFVMLAPPVYAIQGVLVYFWKPSKHPLMEMFKDSPDASFFIVLFVAASVVAPIFEELVFRVILQGFLEKVFTFRGPAHELFFGSPSYAAVEPLAESNQSADSGIVFVADRSPLDADPYRPPTIVGEEIVSAMVEDHENQPILRGLSAWLPIAMSAIIFALLHEQHGPDWVALTVLAAGMGFLYQRTHRLVPSLTVHALLNSLSMFGLWLQVYALPA